MAVRQEDISSAMLSILKKMDKMVQNTSESYNKQNSILSSIEKTFKVEVSMELKKQTKILTSIDKSLSKSQSKGEASILDIFKRKTKEEKFRDDVINHLEIHTELLKSLNNKEKGGNSSFKINTNLDNILLSLPDAIFKLLKVIGVAFLMEPILEEGAKVLTKTLRTLLSFSKGINPIEALTSVSFMAILEASKLRDLLKLFKEVGGIFSIFTLGNIDGGAKRIARAINYLLSIGSPTKENPKGIDPTEALYSSLYINILARAPLKNLINALEDPIDFWSLIGVEKGTRATEAMVNSIRSLLKISEGIRFQDIIKSTFAIAILASSPVNKLIDALKPGLFASMFSASGGGAKIQKRTEGFAGAIRSLLLISEGIDNETIIKSVLSIGMLALGVDVLISAMKSAAIWNPLLIIGVRITNKIITTLVGGMSEVLKDGENLVYAGIYLVLLSFSLGTIMTMTVVAALLAPLIMIGALVIRFSINQLLSIKRSVDKENLNQTVLSKFETLGLIVSAVIGAIAVLIALDSKVPLTDVLIKIGFFLVISNVLTFTTLYLSKKLSSAKQGEFDKFSIMAAGISNMMNAISIVILAKALENPAESFKKVAMFVVLFAAISFSTMYTVSLLTKTKKGQFDSLALLATGITNILNAIAVVILSKAMENPGASFSKVFMFILIFGALTMTSSYAMKQLKDVKFHTIIAFGVLIVAMVAMVTYIILFTNKFGVGAVENVGLFLLIFGGIVLATTYFAKQIGNKFNQILKASMGIVIFSAAITLVALMINNFVSVVNPLAVAYLILSIGAISYVMFKVGENQKNLIKGALAMALVSLSVSLFIIPLANFVNSGFGLMHALTLSLIILGVTGAFYLAGLGWKQIMKGSLALGIAGLSLWLITPPLAMFAQSGFTIENSFSLSITLMGMALGFGLAGLMWTSIMKGALALTVAGIALLLISPALAIFAISGFSPMNAIALSIALLGMTVSFGLAGIFWTSIMKGALALTIAGLSLWLITPPLAMFAQSGFTIENGLTLAGTLGLMGLVFGLAGLGPVPLAIAAGALALGLSAGAIWLMSYALKEFQTLNWTQKNSDNLAYTIKSVLMALSGTSDKKGIMDNISGAVGQGLQSIMALLSAGPLLVGSAAIWLMSVALEKFQSINWGPSDNEHLALTISSVLGALSGNSPNVPKAMIGAKMLDNIIAFMSAGALVVGSLAIWLMSGALIQFKTVGWDKTQNSILGDTISMVLGALSGNAPNVSGSTGKRDMLDLIVSLMSAGSLIAAAASIWLLSEALIKFKTVKWSADDTKQLSFTMSEILSVMTGAEEGGGVWGAISGAAKGLIGSVGSAGNATSIGLSALSIIKLSDALLKWKGLGWDKNQTNNLRYAIDQILISFKSSTPDGLESVANNFDKIQNSMKLLKGHINDMDLKKLTLTDSMMRSIAMLSKSPEAIGEKIAESIDKAFEGLAKAIAESMGEIKSESKGEGIISKATGAVKDMFSGGGEEKGKSPQPAQQRQLTVSEIETAMTNALQSVSGSLTVKVKSGF